MRIAVPVSGGLDSAVLLYETLRDTAHEVCTIHISEAEFESSLGPQGPEIDDDAARRVVEWCARNARPVAASFDQPVRRDLGTGERIPDDLEVAYRHPDSPNRHLLHTTAAVWASLGVAADRIRPDEVWMGTHSWNYRGSQALVGYTSAALHGQTDVPVRHPFLEANHPGRGYPVPGEPWGPGRMSQYRRLPAPMRAFVMGCRLVSDGRPCGKCDGCSTEPFYREFCEGADDAELRRIEAMIERDGLLGRWYHMADPQTFRRHDVFDLLRDHDYWRAMLATRCDAEQNALRTARRERLKRFNRGRGHGA